MAKKKKFLKTDFEDRNASSKQESEKTLNKKKIDNYKSKEEKIVKKSKQFRIEDYLIYTFLFVLALLIFVIYLPAMNAGFYYDDNHTVLTQHLIREVGLGELIGSILSMNARSFLTLTYYLNFKMSYIDAWSYHLLSIIIHIINTVLAFYTTKFLLKSFKSGLTENLNKYLPYITAVIFAVHPLMTEGTTYVSSRSDQLPTMMTLIALISFIKFIDSKKVWLLILAGGGFALGLLSKQTGVMIPFVLGLYLFFYARENDRKITDFFNWKYIGGTIIAFAILFYRSFGTLNAIGAATKIGELVPTTPLIHYIFSAIYAHLFYLRLLFYPYGQSIRHDTVIIDSITSWKLLLAVGLLMLLFYLLWKFFRRNNLLLFSVLSYFLVLLPVASIVRLIEVVSEHRLYHPFYGFGLAISLLILLLIQRFKDLINLKYLVASVFFVIFVALSLLTYNRNLVWLGEIPLWTDALAKRDPEANSTVIYNNVGLAYFRDGQTEPAIKWYTYGAVTSGLSSYHNLANLGTLYRDKGEYDRAIRFFDLAIAAKPDFAYAHFDQGVAFAQKGDLENAERKFLDTLKIDEYYLGAHRNVAIIEQKKGNLDKAIEYLEKGFQLEPYEGKYMHDIAMIYMEKGELEKAQEYLMKAAQMMPNEASPWLNLGLTFLDQKKPNEALDALTRAYSLNQSYVDIFYFQGIAYELLGDKMNAKSMYEKAIQANSTKANDANLRIQSL